MKTRFRRLLAAFLLVNILQSVFLPTIASALTSGPSTPETTNFEPVDTTDMVNIGNGDFTYNVPLLEVPGPEGGYPISLSYNAGIKPMEEASWVGLGWSLNPGALNRTVNGWADDALASIKKVEDHWDGGETKTFSVGVSYGIPSTRFGVSAHVSRSTDTYRGIGWGGGIGASIGAMKGADNNMLTNSSPNVGVGLSYHQWSGFSGSANLGFGTNKGNSLGVNGSTNFRGQNGFGISASVAGRVSVGMDISSGKARGSMSIAGISLSSNNNNFGKISSYSNGFNVPIPIGTSGLFVDVGYSYQRYWMSEKDYVTSYGILYGNQANSWTPPSSTSLAEPDGPANASLDSYSILSYDSGHVYSIGNPDKQLGGSFPAYDSYQVLGQGIGGSIQPYSFENSSLFRQLSKINVTEIVANYGRRNGISKKVNFRFVNDFSNSTSFTPPTFTFGNTWTPNSPGNPEQVSSTPPSGYPNGLKGGSANSEIHLAGSKHVEWYTNNDIKNGTNVDGFINTQDISNTDRATFISGKDISSQIGGFSITNTSGVTYHYGLPVYSFDEYTKSSKLDNQNVETYNKQTNPEPYAYTWLLTAVTGPDFVDVNGDKLANDGDYGYWITFHYGKWADNYQWRNPAEGFDRDLQGADIYSFGRKQIYYLDAIKTRTHTALFVKSPRFDGKGVNELDYGGWQQSGYEYFNRECTHTCTCDNSSWTCIDKHKLSGVKPTSLLKLKKILLYKNEDLPQTVANIKDNGVIGLSQVYTLTDQTIGGSCEVQEICCGDTYSNVSCPSTNLSRQFHYENNVVDSADVVNTPNLALKAYKAVELTTSYELCPETPNSFANTFYASGGAWPTAKSGKLTLNEVKFKGKNDVTSMPPLKFTYDTPSDPYGNTTSLNLNGQDLLIPPSSMGFAVGKIISFTKNSDGTGLKYYYLLTEYSQSTGYKYIRLGANSVDTNTTYYKTITTKNLPFKNDFYDWWGYYKCDFAGGVNDAVSKDSRKPSTVSGNYLDVWSLKSIETSLGAKINVEYYPKDFTENVVRKDNEFLNMTNITGTNPSGTGMSNLTITLGATVPFSVGSQVNIVAPVDLYFSGNLVGGAIINTLGTVASVNGNSFTINNIAIYTLPKYDLSCNSSGTDPATLSYTFQKGFVYRPNSTADDGIGDGIKVASIAVTSSDGTNYSRKTKYQYQNGTTSYQPSEILPAFTYTGLSAVCTIPIATNLYAMAFQEYYLPLAREIPGPGVLYGKVTITEEANGLPVPGSKEYNFKMFDWNMVNYAVSNSSASGTGTHASPRLLQRTVTMKNKTGLIGALISEKLYDGNGKLVQSTKNNYLDENFTAPDTDYDQYNRQGIVEQVFNEIRYNYTSSALTRYAVQSKKIDYPTILASTENYANGRTSTTYNRRFDFYSGELLATETLDAYDNKIRSVTLPAYRVSDTYGNPSINTNTDVGMGLKIWNIQNKHMLSQSAGSNLYKVSAWLAPSDATTANVAGTLSASATTWSRDWTYRNYVSGSYVPQVETNNNKKVWRKQKEYVWKSDSNPDGTFASFTPFDYTTPPTGWQKVSETTLYDRFSKPLEEQDINGNYATAKLGYNESLVIGAASNAKYTEMYYTGCEDLNGDWFGGEVTRFNGNVETAYAHTGSKCLRVTAGAGPNGFVTKMKVGTDIVAGRTYQISVWVKDDGNLANRKVWTDFKNASGVLVAGSPTAVTASNYAIKAGGWVLVNHQITVPSSGYTNYTLTVGVQTTGTTGNHGYYDDFRIRPIDAPMTSYVYDPQTGQVTYILGNDHLYTQYQYDDAGRLIAVYAETPENPTGKRKVSEHVYHYKRPLD